MKSTKTRSVSKKETYLAEIEAAIAAAPDEPESITKERKFKTIRKKIVMGPDGLPDPHKSLFEVEVNRICSERYRRMTKRVERLLKEYKFDKVTFHFGPTTYEVWNTKEALRGFRNRFKRQFRK